LSISVELYPDADLSTLIARARAEVAIRFPFMPVLPDQWRPHLTLLIANEIDRHRGEDVLRQVAEEITTITLTFSRMACFDSDPGHVYLVPDPSPKLSRAHGHVHLRFGQKAKDLWPNYVSARWIPHCTIAERVPREHLQAVMTTVQSSLPSLPLPATIEEIGLVDFPPLNRVALCPLKRSARSSTRRAHRF
jgi:2'-5' RNA ligase